MALRRIWPLLVATVFPLLAKGAEPFMWPSGNLATFVFQHLDLTTFRNSTGPRRQEGQRLFADLGIKATRTSDTEAVSESDDWTYSIKVIARRDFNRDGVQEVAICFTDTARQGSYNVQQPLLLQWLEGRAVALAYDISTDSDAAQCKSSR